jgi:hypothetical protein
MPASKQASRSPSVAPAVSATTRVCRRLPSATRICRVAASPLQLRHLAARNVFNQNLPLSTGYLHSHDSEPTAITRCPKLGHHGSCRATILRTDELGDSLLAQFCEQAARQPAVSWIRTQMQASAQIDHCNAKPLTLPVSQTPVPARGLHTLLNYLTA